MADPHMQAQLDHAARQRGFQDYQHYHAWNSQQQQMQQQQAAPQAPPQPQQPAPPPKNWLQNLIDQYTPLGGAMARVKQVL